MLGFEDLTTKTGVMTTFNMGSCPEILENSEPVHSRPSALPRESNHPCVKLRPEDLVIGSKGSYCAFETQDLFPELLL